MELYQFGDSPCCMKVRMVMAEKGLDREIKTVASYKFDHYQPDYQALNPHSLVPTLVHEGRVVIQSSNIAEYLDEMFPDPPLQPQDPFEKSKMREWMKEEEEFLFPLIVTLSFNTMMKLRAEGYGMEQLREWSLTTPTKNVRRIISPASHRPLIPKDLRRRKRNFGGTWSGLKGNWKKAAGPGFAVAPSRSPISALPVSWTARVS